LVLAKAPGATNSSSYFRLRALWIPPSVKVNFWPCGLCLFVFRVHLQHAFSEPSSRLLIALIAGAEKAWPTNSGDKTLQSQSRLPFLKCGSRAGFDSSTACHRSD
jgi:hypothetical protein